MRVLGDLNGPEGNALNNPPGSETTEKNGNVKAHGRHFGDPIGEQRLEPERYSNSPARLFARHTNGGLWFLLMVLTLAMLGAGAYSYLRLRNNHVTLSQVPGLLRSVPTLGGRMDATEAKLREWSGNWRGLTDHLFQLDQKIDSGLRAARKQTRELVGQASAHLQAELDQHAKEVDARLSRVESLQKQDQERLAQLNDQLRGQVAGLHEQLSAAQENTGHDLANVQEQVSNSQDNLHTLTQQLHRDKMTFEVVTNSPAQLAPGVTLTVLKTDVAYQRFRGYVSFTDDGRTVWFNNVNANEAVDLYARQDSHPYSLVVTTVNDHGVVGYLLLPAGV